MSEIVFLVEEDPDGGYRARALGESIFTEADDTDALRKKVREAVQCHFGDECERVGFIRMTGVHNETMSDEVASRQ